MLRIELNDDEVRVLREVLQEYVSDLRMEIGATDSMDFREGLKEKERFLKAIQARLERPPS